MTKLYSLVAYTVGLSALTLYMLFMGQWQFMPININSGEEQNTLFALLINFILITIFSLQHSIMARASFKAKITRFLPAEIERSTYVLLSGICLFAICMFWQNSAGVIWQVDNAIFYNILIALQIVGWLVLVAATFEIDHFELMGLKQVFVKTQDTQPDNKKLVEKYLYRFVRHPIQLGVFIGIWSTPNMTLSHFTMTSFMTIYMFVGLYFEEKSLVNYFGEQYKDYQRRVPMVFPIKF